MGCVLSRGQSACLLEADFRHATLCNIDELKEFACFEAEEIRDHVGGEFLDLGVQVSDDGVVVAASILQVIFDVIEGSLKLREAFDRA